MDEIASKLAAIATVIFIIVFVISWIVSGVQAALDAGLEFLENVWIQVGQLWQQIREYFQDLMTYFDNLEPPIPPPISTTVEPTIELIPSPISSFTPPATPTLGATSETVACGAFISGNQAVVCNTQSRGLRCRADHNTSADIVVGLADGDEVILEAGPISQEGFEWWQLELSNQTLCWAASDWICPVEISTPVSSSPAPPIPIPGATPVPPTTTPIATVENGWCLAGLLRHYRSLNDYFDVILVLETHIQVEQKDLRIEKLINDKWETQAAGLDVRKSSNTTWEISIGLFGNWREWRLLYRCD